MIKAQCSSLDTHNYTLKRCISLYHLINLFIPPAENLPPRMIYILICWSQRMEQLVMTHLTIENEFSGRMKIVQIDKISFLRVRVSQGDNDSNSS